MKLKTEYDDPDETLVTVKSGQKKYRVCIRPSGRNHCTCPFGYVHKFNEDKKCKHEKQVLEAIE